MLEVDEFLNKLRKHTVRKAQLYDGVNKDMSVDTALRYAIEELGEVATSITRDRHQSILDECIDLAHCAFLIYKSEKNKKEQD